MKTIRRKDTGTEVRILQELLKTQGYFDGCSIDGIFGPVTEEQVELFQLQHIDEDGQQLVADGVVGPKTWWALNHASGDDQKNHLEDRIPKGVTDGRVALLKLIFAEHAKPVFEDPNGSNSSPDIDGYWGNTGVKALPWCCAFVSWALKKATGMYPISGKHHLGVQNMWRAAKGEGLGADSPKPGDIFVQIKSRGTGHTGFVIGLSKDGNSIYTCEGNCGNRLKIGKRKVSTINHYIDALQDGQSSEFERSDLNVKSVNKDTDR